jgi:hypothetical protein
MRRSSDRLSDIVERLAGTGSEGVSLADVLAAVGERSFGALLVLFALPNVFAGVLPGLSIVLGLPLMLLSLQLLVAARKPWLPARLARLEVRTRELRRLADALVPRRRVLERGLKPRLLLMTAPWAERLIGAACLALATLVFLPIPFANLLPAAGIMLFGSALLERDGLVAIAAVAVTAVSLALFGGVAFAFATAAGHAFRQLSLFGG